MPPSMTRPRTDAPLSCTARDRAARVRAYFEAQRRLRKGLCLLSAGVFESAVEELAAATRINPTSDDLAVYLVRALATDGRFAEAADAAARHAGENPTDVTRIVRLALAQWKAGGADDAVRTLREGVANHTDRAELHYQLGTMLAALDQHEEAELRFVQAIAIEKDHADALVALGLSCAARGDTGDALRHLQRAQRLRPGDARVAFLLAQAAQAARASGETGTQISLFIEMPVAKDAENDQAIAHLGRMIDRDPEFVEAFLALDPSEVDETVFSLLALTLNRAIARHPKWASLHYLTSRVLERLGRSDEAIAAAERAVDIDPRHVQALILLAELYRQTDRCADARKRLEETVLLGAEYADTYYLLGNLYREDGQLQRARWAYQQALRINDHYTAAQEALAALAA